MKEMWDNRYSSKEYAYGVSPNKFFKDTINKFELSGSILLPAEGEGRNAVYAAKKGIDVYAFDISIEGKKKALKLAEKDTVKINYEVGDFFDLELINHNFDAVGLIYAHFPPNLLLKYHKKIAELIKINGLIILEGFSKNHLKFKNEGLGVGGPDNSDMLFSIETIQRDFPDFETIHLEEIQIELTEGKFHNGMAKVIRYIGKKIK